MIRTLMTLSAAFLALLGIGASFAPGELAAYAGGAPDPFGVTVTQLAGAAWLAFALVDWAARGSMMGGIYGRPIALGNFAHFAIGGVVLAKVALHGPASAALVAVTAAYLLLGAAFAWVLFVRDPLPPSDR